MYSIEHWINCADGAEYTTSPRKPLCTISLKPSTRTDDGAFQAPFSFVTKKTENKKLEIPHSNGPVLFHRTPLAIQNHEAHPLPLLSVQPNNRPLCHPPVSSTTIYSHLILPREPLGGSTRVKRSKRQVAMHTHTHTCAQRERERDTRPEKDLAVSYLRASSFVSL